MPKFYSITLLLSIAIAGCDSGPSNPRGFSLPEGDIETGKQVFYDFKCLACHTLNGIDEVGVKKEMSFSVVLGGKVSRVKTYAQLVTYVINPSHQISPSYNPQMVAIAGETKMRIYTVVMTVHQLIIYVTIFQPN